MAKLPKFGNKDKDALSRVSEAYRKANEDWDGWLTECEEDYKFTLGDQWKVEDKQVLNEQGRPILSLNIMKKQIDTISGYERQNQTSVKVAPIEGGDQAKADYLTEIMKWVYEYGKFSARISDAFYDAVVCGVGWIHPYVDYSKDAVSGDIKLKRENPFRIMFDTETTEHDLSDCNYIIRHAWLSREQAKVLYPDKADDIDTIDSSGSKDFYIQQPIASHTDYVNIVEYWRREVKERNFLIQKFSGEMIELDDEKEAKKIKNIIESKPATVFDQETGETYGDYVVLKRKVNVIKMTSVCEETILLYDGDNPFGTDEYPFIPIFGWWTPTYNDITLKIQGLARLLKDPQREKNKRRSKLLHSAMQLPYSKWFVQRGTIVDPDILKNSGEAGGVIEYEGQKPEQSPPQQISPGLIQLEEMFSNDMREMGLNADMLGMSGQAGGSGQSAPGITLQIRQKQGLTSIQTLFDNLSYAKAILGNYMVKAITMNFTPQKMIRITDQPPPDINFYTGARYDCQIEEAPDTPTYRAYQLMLILELLGKGIAVPPEVIVETSDLPQEFKDLIKEQMKGQQESQAQVQQMTMQKEQQEIENDKAKIANDQAEIQIKMKRLELDAMIAGIKAKGEESKSNKTDAETQKIESETENTGIAGVLDGFNTGQVLGEGMEQAGIGPDEIAQGQIGQPQPEVI